HVGVRPVIPQCPLQERELARRRGRGRGPVSGRRAPAGGAAAPRRRRRRCRRRRRRSSSSSGSCSSAPSTPRWLPPLAAGGGGESAPTATAPAAAGTAGYRGTTSTRRCRSGTGTCYPPATVAPNAARTSPAACPLSRLLPLTRRRGLLALALAPPLRLRRTRRC
ncbi:unnamed protein product, partial [Ectocarpus sp. 8 AP-2014]